MSTNDWKSRLNVVYSTDPDYEYQTATEQETETLPNHKQNLRITLDKKRRAGKQVTLIVGYKGSEDDLKELGKFLKTKCGVGGSAKDGEIILQGDFRQKAEQILSSEGYKVRVI